MEPDDYVNFEFFSRGILEDCHFEAKLILHERAEAYEVEVLTLSNVRTRRQAEEKEEQRQKERTCISN